MSKKKEVPPDAPASCVVCGRFKNADEQPSEPCPRCGYSGE